jgi:uncharacterized protein
VIRTAALVLFCVPLLAVADVPKIALIIDDIGDQSIAGERVVALPAPVVCSVLPWTPHAVPIASACHAAGKEVFLHLPMQAVNGNDPGAGALTLDMYPEELAQATRDALAVIPHASGVNNHMGSLLTQAPGPMRWLMRELLDFDPSLIFVDSRTSPNSLAERKARRYGLAHQRRDVFLDNLRDEAAIGAQIALLVTRARQHGVAVGIGHPYPETLAVLESILPTFEADHGVRLVPLRSIAIQP